ncbi:MAG: hypothetical protein LBP35_06200 [Candidatus Ancillula trichonymphae]|nr:hypothetical protein [Candidatus Ancillula trichonymphae]
MKEENFSAECISAITSLSLLLFLFAGSSVALVSFSNQQVAQHAVNQLSVLDSQGKTGRKWSRWTQWWKWW